MVSMQMVLALQEEILVSMDIHCWFTSKFCWSVTNNVCPYAIGSSRTTPSFVGSDYFCESGCSGNYDLSTFYTDRLWDGEQCGAIEGGCCRGTGLSWFHKTLSTPTSELAETLL